MIAKILLLPQLPLSTMYYYVSAPDFLMRNECLVDLHKVTDIDLPKLVSLEEMKAAAANFDMVKRLEEILMVWHSQIDQVCPSVRPSVCLSLTNEDKAQTKQHTEIYFLFCVYFDNNLINGNQISCFKST